MYENENNRSGGYREDSTYHYVYRQPEEPKFTPRPPKEKKKKTWLKTCLILLAVAIAGGVVGSLLTSAAGGAGLFGDHAEIAVSDRTVKEVQIVKVDGKAEMTAAEAYAANVNATVSVNVSGTTTNFFGYTTPTASSGSGFIATTDGYIITNYHVIEGGNDIEVTLYNGDSYDAAIVGGEEDYDVAVLKINAQGLQAVTFGDSDKVNVGERVLAIGNPLGELTFSVSEGIASSVNRAINVDGTPFNMIQIDASVNPGNSGGPLLNLYGEVIGIVSAKYSSYASTTAEGLGFAIPINDVSAVVQDIMENGYVTDKAYIGIKAYTVNSEYVEMYKDLLTEGVYVSEVESGGAAELAGLKAGDIIIKLAGKEVIDMASLTAAKKGFRAGDTTEIVVFRNGEEVTMSITFGTEPEKDETEEEQSQQIPQQQQPYYNMPNMYDYFDYFFGH